MAPGSFEISWRGVEAVAELADDIGFDMLLPFSRWKGLGGRTNAGGGVFETLTWAAGLAARTKRITVVAAKAATTIDLISGGRFALNIVMGWLSPEPAMFGQELLEHDERYCFGEEWVTIVRRLWAESEPFDLRGKHFEVTGAESYPKPLRAGGPAIINAGSPPAGVRFSVKHTDVNFTSIFTLDRARDHVQQLKGIAREEHGRDISVMTYETICCADTEAEAKARYERIIAHADWEAVANHMRFVGLNSESFDDQLRHVQERFVTTTSGGYPIVGTPNRWRSGSSPSPRLESTAWCSASWTTNRNSPTSRRRCFRSSRKPGSVSDHRTPTAGAVRLLAVGGSRRSGSSSEQALRVVAAAARERGAVVELITGRDLMLPIHDPGSAHRSTEVRRLIEGIRKADGLLLSSPGYHGTLSGMIKNALDYVEDLRDDPRVYLDGMPVGCVAVAYGWQASVSTLHSLSVTVHALRGWPSPYGAAINTSAKVFGPAGGCLDQAVDDQLSTIAAQVVEFAALRKPTAPADTPTRA